MLKASFEHAATLDWILQSRGQIAAWFRRCERMTTDSSLLSRRRFRADGAKATTQVLFGTTGLSDVFAFGTAMTMECGR
jgi:hypothetical protein